jgi:hypothetical protein
MTPYLLWPEVFTYFPSPFGRGCPGGQVRGFKTYFFRIQNHLTPAPLLLGEEKKQTIQSSLILRGEKTKHSPRDGKINFGLQTTTCRCLLLSENICHNPDHSFA